MIDHDRQYSRDKIAEQVLTTFKIDCDPWGVTVERVEVDILHYHPILHHVVLGEELGGGEGDGGAHGHGSKSRQGSQWTCHSAERRSSMFEKDQVSILTLSVYTDWQAKAFLTLDRISTVIL